MPTSVLAPKEATAHEGSPLEVLAVFTRLGLTSFGGPVAHIGYFREELVVRRQWTDEASYADLVALCQTLPGPASSQVGIAMGLNRAGLLGSLAAWAGFTLPSAVALVLFALGVGALGNADAGWLHGLKVVAVAVVALAVWGMGRSMASDRPRATIAILSAVVLLLWQGAIAQVVVLVAAGLVGWRLFTPVAVAAITPRRLPVSRAFGAACLGLFVVLLVGLPLLRGAIQSPALAILDGFYRAGALVFGGGHVVLPLLQAEVLPTGWVTGDQFVAGYGATQAVPGPLFAFAAYLGAAMTAGPVGWPGAALALGAIYLPAYLLVVGALPFWDRLRALRGFRGAITGVNAAVVGLLLAALYNPVWTSAMHAPRDVALGLAAFALLAFWKVAPWLVVVFAAVAGAAFAIK